MRRGARRLRVHPLISPPGLRPAAHPRHHCERPRGPGSVLDLSPPSAGPLPPCLVETARNPFQRMYRPHGKKPLHPFPGETPAACGKTLQSRSPRLGKCLQRLCVPPLGCQVGRRLTTRVCRVEVGSCLTYRGLWRGWTWKRSSSEKAPRGGTAARPLDRNARHSALWYIPCGICHLCWHSNRNQPRQGAPIRGALTLPHCTMGNVKTQHGRTALPKESPLAFYCESNRAWKCCLRAATSPYLAASFKEMAGGCPLVVAVVTVVVVVVGGTLVSAMGFSVASASSSCSWCFWFQTWF